MEEVTLGEVVNPVDVAYPVIGKGRVNAYLVVGERGVRLGEVYGRPLVDGKSIECYGYFSSADNGFFVLVKPVRCRPAEGIRFEESSAFANSDDFYAYMHRYNAGLVSDLYSLLSKNQIVLK